MSAVLNKDPDNVSEWLLEMYAKSANICFLSPQLVNPQPYEKQQELVQMNKLLTNAEYFDFRTIVIERQERLLLPGYAVGLTLNGNKDGETQSGELSDAGLLRHVLRMRAEVLVAPGFDEFSEDFQNLYTQYLGQGYCGVISAKFSPEGSVIETMRKLFLSRMDIVVIIEDNNISSVVQPLENGRSRTLWDWEQKRRYLIQVADVSRTLRRRLESSTPNRPWLFKNPLSKEEREKIIVADDKVHIDKKQAKKAKKAFDRWKEHSKAQQNDMLGREDFKVLEEFFKSIEE